MEERANDPTFRYDDHDHDHDHNHNHVHEDEEYFDNEEEISSLRRKDDYHQSMQIVPSTGPPPHETYIVQIPKDQIYRVPPPENAEIVERYRKPVQKTKGSKRRCVYWFLSIFFVVAFIISVVVCVHKFTLSPNPPTFSVKQLALKQSSKKNAPPGFQVSVETTNPNKVNDLGYKQGSVSLMYKGKEIGKGQFPALDNEATGKSDAVEMVLAGSKGGLPKDLQKSDSSKSHNTKKRKAPQSSGVVMNLSMNIPIDMKSWLWTKTVGYKVKCEFEVDSFGDNMKVQSQKCDVNK